MDNIILKIYSFLLEKLYLNLNNKILLIITQPPIIIY